MNNIMNINGHKAVIQFDPDIGMLRGEFVGLSGGADFYATDVAGLQREGEISLRVYLEACEKRGIEPLAKRSGALNLRVQPELHRAVTIAAKAAGKSINQWATEALQAAAHG